MKLYSTTIQLINNENINIFVSQRTHSQKSCNLVIYYFRSRCMVILKPIVYKLLHPFLFNDFTLSFNTFDNCMYDYHS